MRSITNLGSGLLLEEFNTGESYKEDIKVPNNLLNYGYAITLRGITAKQ
jgi:hypothetical protein